MLLQNTRHEQFSQLVASGREKVNAYREVYPRAAGWSKNAVRVAACRLAKKCGGRIRELQTVGARATIATREELAVFMTRVIRTPIADIDASSDLAQEKTVRTLAGEEEGVVEKIKIPDKLAAVDGLRKMMGYDEPEKHETAFVFETDEAVLAKMRSNVARAGVKAKPK